MKPLSLVTPGDGRSPFEVAGLPAGALDQAIAWAVKLQSGTADTGERAACAAWRAADPLNEQAWQQVQSVEEAFRSVPRPAGHVAFQTLQAAAHQQRLSGGRRRALKLLSLGAIGVATGIFALLHAPGQQRAVYATGIGQRRSLTLADGTQLQLNTGSEVDVVFSPLRRLIALRQGEILIETGRDADSLTGRRPFWVETAQARLEAIGTRFTVRQAQGQTRLHVMEGAVAIHSRAEESSPVIVVRAGDTYAIGPGSAAATRVTDADLDPTAWADGVLVAKQMRLDAFAAELSRYRRNAVRCDDTAAELRVSGVFQLDGADPAGRALEVLAHTLPVKVIAGADGTLTVARL